MLEAHSQDSWIDLMGLIRRWWQKWPALQRNTQAISLESKQTGSCGGMSTTELKIRIELILDGVDTRSIIEPVTEIAALSHALQSEFLSELSDLADISVSHAYSLMQVYASALSLIKAEEIPVWLEQIKQAVRANAPEQASSLIENYADFISELDSTTVAFSDVAEVLEKLVSTVSQHALSVRCLDSGEDKQGYTDGYQLFLPASISLFDSYHDNYLLYKVIAFQLLAQLECETASAINTIEQGIAEHGQDFLDAFSVIETVRINHYLKNTFPGIWKNILLIHRKSGIQTYPELVFSGYVQPTVFDSLTLVQQLGIKTKICDPLPYQSCFSPENLARLPAEEVKPQPILMSRINDGIEVDSEGSGRDNLADRIYLKHASGAASPAGLPSSDNAIWESLNETLTQHQVAREKLRNERTQKNVYFYPEWDISLKQYRQDWCRVEEKALELHPDEVDSLAAPDLKFSEYHIKKTLDLIINNQRLIRHQSDGDDIDIDAWVDASSNKTKHADAFQQVYIRNNKNSRSVAIMFAVDISGSTAGWKNKTIKQSIWLLSRTLAKLNDQYAIYAFSGSGREQCHIYPVKTFNESDNMLIKQRIFSLQAQQYTRMGAAVRHLSKTLNQAAAKTKILFVLTDGKPDDIDSYRGHYGIEDTRRAFNEAKALCLNPFVLTFDQECMDYLPYMLGKNRYRLISDIAMLPLQISTIYKQLTT